MLSRPDFLEKQIVVISSDTFKGLALKNDNLVVYKEKKLIDQIACSKVFCIFVIGECTLSTKLIDRLLHYQISIYLFTQSLYPRCIIGGQLEGNYVLREKQYHASDVYTLDLAKQLIQNKIANQGKLLKTIRNKNTACKEALKKIADLYEKAGNIDNQDSLRGIEGNSAKIFFAHYYKDIGRYKRLPRTKVDIINLLMDIGYTFLYRFIEANLNLYGFDIYKGIYHTLFYERKSLVCDLVEPWRSIIDKKIKKMYNLKQINEKDFGFKNGKYYIKGWEKSKKYTAFFLKTILEHKMDIFAYIKSYYQMRMKGHQEMPLFYIDKS